MFQQIRAEGGFVSTRLFLPKVIIGPSERSPLRGHFHAWLIEQLWYHEFPTAARVGKLNDETVARLRRLGEIRTLIVDDRTATIDTVAALGSLPNLERLQIDGDHLTDACVRSLLRLTRLRYLRMREASISDKAISQLAALPNLVSLDVEGTPLTDRGLAAIAACQRLRELNIARTHVTDEGLRMLNGHPKLTRLWLASDASWQESPAVKRVHLDNLPRLETLHLPSQLDSLELTNLPSLTELPADWGPNNWLSSNVRFYSGPLLKFGFVAPFPRPMQHGVNAKHLLLRGMPGLNSLALDRRQIVSLELDVANLQTLSTTRTNEWLPFGSTHSGYLINDWLCELIGRNKALQHLSLVDASLSRYGWAQLSSLRELQSLDLTRSNVTDEDLGAFSTANKLQTLALADTQISNDGWVKLPRLPLLQKLDVSHTQIKRLDLEGLPELDALTLDETPLESLRLKDLPKLTGSLVVTSSGPLVFEAVNLPAITGLYLEHQCIEQMTLEGLRNLDQLHLTGSTVDDAMLRDLEKWLNLQSLELRDTHITDNTLRRIGKFQNLHRLDLENTAITDAGLVAIGPQIPLTVLNLTGTNISDRGLRHLSGQQELELLYLGGTRVGGPGLQHLANVTSLRKLSLGETNVTSDGLAHLQNLRNLQWLRLSDTKIDDSSFQHLNRLTDLRSLFLNGTSVTDQGIATSILPDTLRELDIASTGVTPHGASQINGSVKVAW